MQDHLERIATLPYHARWRRAGDETTYIQGPGRAASGRGDIPRRQRTAGTRSMVEDPVGRRRTASLPKNRLGGSSARVGLYGFLGSRSVLSGPNTGRRDLRSRLAA